MTRPGDIQSPRVIKIKGLLFALIGLIAIGMLIVRDPSWATVALCGIAIWAWCRFYYFLFYVLENYAGRKRPYAGVFDALLSLFRKD